MNIIIIITINIIIYSLIFHCRKKFHTKKNEVPKRCLPPKQEKIKN